MALPKILLTTACSIALAACSCVLDLTGGGSGTNTGNGVIIGRITDTLGRPVPGSRVALLPVLYNPFAGGPIPDSLTGTTNNDGSFSLKAPLPDMYNIEAADPVSGNRALITGISVGYDDTITVTTTSLRRPAILKIQVSYLTDSLHSYVYIPGTTRGSRVRGNYAQLDSVPAGFIPALYFADAADSTRNHVIKTSFTIAPASIAVIEDYNGWKYSKKFYLNTTASGADVAENVLDFPVLVRLTAANFPFGQAKTDGSDLRFAKIDDTPLPCEIERWDAAAQQAEIWVKADTVYGNNTSQSLTMRWGNPAALRVSDGPAVFDDVAGFAGVWHMNDRPISVQNDSTETIRDATGNGNHGTAGGDMTISALVPGQIGLALDFDGTNDYVDVGTGPSIDLDSSFMLEAWIYPVQYPDSSYQSDAMIIAKYDCYTLELQQTGGLESLTSYAPLASYRLTTQNLRLDLNTWHHISIQYGGGSQKIYHNGLAVTSQSVLDRKLNHNAYHTLIGYIEFYTGVDRFFPGRIDEVRISHVTRPDAWLKLGYMNQKGQDALVVFR